MSEVFPGPEPDEQQRERFLSWVRAFMPGLTEEQALRQISLRTIDEAGELFSTENTTREDCSNLPTASLSADAILAAMNTLRERSKRMLMAQPYHIMPPDLYNWIQKARREQIDREGGGKTAIV